jgi:hypothetical protein
MIPCGLVVNDVAKALSADDDKELMIRIWDRLQFEWFRVCAEWSWDFLRCPPVSLDFSAATATGLWLPSDLMGIDQVWDDTNSTEFFEVGRADAQADEWGERFYRYKPSRAPLFEGTDLILAKGGTTFTSAALTADGETVTSEYVKFGSEPGFYQISNTATPFAFTPTYRGPRMARENFIIRPWESSERMVLIDKDEDELLDRTVSVYYWRAPVALYREEDPVPMYMSQLLKLRTLRGIHEARDRAPVSERMLATALSDAKKQNRKFRGVQSPRDKHGERFSIAANPFKAR